jgi:hypothetical protein
MFRTASTHTPTPVTGLPLPPAFVALSAMVGTLLGAPRQPGPSVAPAPQAIDIMIAEATFWFG